MKNFVETVVFFAIMVGIIVFTIILGGELNQIDGWF